MATELNLRFPERDSVIVSYDGEESGALAFRDPLTAKDRQDLRWYLEVYGAHSLGDPDDAEAARIAARLPAMGRALFDAALGDRAALRLFTAFQDATDEARLLTISAESPAVLALPWELLHDSARGGVFLFNERPRISIRRRIAGARGGRAAAKVTGRERIHLLFVVSRPAGAGFLDPRADASAVLDAVEAHAPGRCTWEFLRPPTLDALVERLDDARRPPPDILHFDGHGVFDTGGGLPERLASRNAALAHGAGDEKLRGVTTGFSPLSPPNTGYLLFETADGEADPVGADRFGMNLHRRHVPLVILSSCQSAAHGDGDEPLGSVAARLTAAGIPAVLAMTYSVLAPTTRALFGEFYKHVGQQRTIGEALDAARLHLYNHPEKYDVQRGGGRVPLRLYDWFVPALYQSGADVPLMRAPAADAPPAPPAAHPSNVPAAPEAGFFGRKRELWDIERWFAGRARRVTVSGFGGQGKTALAHEAARWLTRIGLFEAAVFVDYSRVQAVDAVPIAMNQIGSVLGETLTDVAAATDALRRTPTLLVLDNLETVAAEPLRELLDAARAWSEAGASRVLLTTRAPDFHHADYRNEGTHLHRRVVLAGLGSREAPDAALEWFAELWKLPPAAAVPMPSRQALVELFDLVRFHPLSLRVLAQQLKSRRPAELGSRLEQLLAARAGGGAAGASAATTEATLPELVASVQLSLDRLDAAARAVLPRLGVFQGGAFEDDLQAVTGLGDVHRPRRAALEALQRRLEAGDPVAVLQALGITVPDDVELPPDVRERIGAPEREAAAARVQEALAAVAAPAAGPDVWPGLRRQLEAAALVEAETVPGVGVPYLRFHPTLAPMLWAQLDDDERARLATAHRERYHALANYLFGEDDQKPQFARAIALRDLPNLLHAADRAIAAHDPAAVDLTYAVVRFLTLFGLSREAERLTQAARAGIDDHPDAWYLAESQRGEQLLAAGRSAAAREVFEAILARLGDETSARRASTLVNLGRSLAEVGRPDQALERFRESRAVIAGLEPSDYVKRLTSLVHTELADALRSRGEFGEARQEYLAALRIDEELGHVRDQGVSHGQLGALALAEGRLDEALSRFRAALALFRQLGEPLAEAKAWHQLGTVYQTGGDWEEAERHFREAARLKESHGDTTGAARSWNHLGLVSEAAAKPAAAETWFRKALAAFQAAGDRVSCSKCLSNLARLLRDQPGRLAEARQLAEEGLAIDRSIDPGVAMIWSTYGLLEGIVARERALAAPDDPRRAELDAEARRLHRLAREARRDFAGTRHELRQHLPLLLGVVATAHQPEYRPQLDAVLAEREGKGWGNLVGALRRVLDGERDEDALCAALDLEDSMIVAAALAGIADPTTLADLSPPADGG